MWQRLGQAGREKIKKIGLKSLDPALSPKRLIMNKPIFRMSESGHCPRALAAKYLGYPAETEPEWLARAANEGHWHEDRLKQELANDHYLVFDEQLEVSLDYKDFLLVGHIDGKVAKVNEVTEEPENNMLLEIKSMSQYEFDRWMKGRFDEFPEYSYQIACYMIATDLSTCMYLVKNRSSGYIDHQILVAIPLYSEAIRDNLLPVANAIASEQLPEVEFDPASIQCKRCRYRMLCVPKPRDISQGINEAEVMQATIDWRKGKAMADEGQKLMNNAKGILLNNTTLEERKWSFNGLLINLVHIKEHDKHYKEQDQLRINDLEATDAR